MEQCRQAGGVVGGDPERSRPEIEGIMPEPEDDALQFDKAEYEQAAPEEVHCAACGQKLVETYYQVGTQIACERCRYEAEAAVMQTGGGLRRFTRATLYGLLAGAIGSGLWYAVLALANLEVGLIAIVVGLMVGGAVRKGSGGRGGWRYQALAMTLTYASIVTTYIPYVWKDLKASAEQQQAGGQPVAAASATPPGGNAGGQPASTSAGEQQPARPTTGPAAAGQASAEAPPGLARSILMLIVLAVVLFVIACAVPFLGGLENIIGILIIGIALYEAWKINKRVTLEIAGPFRVGAGGSPTPPE